MKEGKPDSEIPPQPKASELADPEDVRKALERAKRILARALFLAMPCSKTVH